MIVFSREEDKRIGRDVCRRLYESGCRRLLEKLLSMDMAKELLANEIEASEVIFVVCGDLSYAKNSVREFRSITSRPIIVASCAGSMSDVLGVLRAGANDFLDICESFELDAKRILARLSPNSEWNVRVRDSLSPLSKAPSSQSPSI